MFENYFKIALRKMNRQKIYASINILGLALGMAGALFILFWVRDERSYDRFHANADRIVRVYQVFNYGEYHLEQTQTPSILATKISEECPEAELVTRVRNFRNEYLVRAEDRKFNEPGLGVADEHFFNFFTFPLVSGNPNTVLSEPYTVVISESAAKKYFGDSEAMGRILNILDEDYIVTGVFRDMPAQSHFHFDVLFSYSSNQEYQTQGWGWNNFKTYVLLKEGNSASALEAKLADIVRSYMFDSQEKYENVFNRGDYTKFLLQRLTDIHLHSDLLWEFESNGNATYVDFFTIIAMFILLIAAINYMNLSTARSAGRAREVGIRKTVGSTRNYLIRQFLMESVVTSLFGFVLSAIALVLLLPGFRNLVGRPWLGMDFLKNPIVWIVWAGSAVVIGLLAGVYPSMFLSSFEPASVLGGKHSRGLKSSRLRNVLVVFQFSISVLLLCATMIVQKQMDFIQTRNLGYNQEQVLVVKTYGELNQRLPVFKEALRRSPAVISVSASYSVPGKGFTNIGMGLEGGNSSHGTNMNVVDADFLRTMDMQMAEGRFFDETNPSDGRAVIVNESEARALGVEDLLSRRMHIYSEETAPFQIIGVIRDFHYESLHEPVKPLAMVMLHGQIDWPEAYVSIRISSRDVPETVDFIRKEWESLVPGTPFQFSFLDAIYNAQYRNEERTGRIFTIFTLFAVFVACMGLLGLASYAVEQRTREIGIRKVLGASEKRIVVLLSSEFLRWVVLANLFGWPAAYFLMVQWLKNFAYRTEIGILPFVMSMLLMLGITAVTVGYHTVRAALARPADSLRHE